MKTFIKHIIALTIRFAFWFRYKITVKGFEKLTPEALNKPGGILFLPNHPSVFVDPASVTLAVWPKFPIRPMIVEYQFYTPGVNWLMRYLDALPIPNFTTSSNSLKRKKSEKMVQTVISDLKRGQNFLIYPSGKTKLTGYESIGGASAVHKILSEAPEANVVLVRTKGLWGSSFSRAITGQVPPMWSTMWKGAKHVFKNLIFFTPRRHIIIELEPAPADFPYKGSRIEMNRYLELYYNKPDGLTKQEGDLPGDSLMLVSYSMWRKEIPQILSDSNANVESISMEKIPKEVQQKVLKKIAELSERDPDSIKPEMNLATDLGMDSLDIAEVAIFLQDYFDLSGIPSVELTTVGKIMALASKDIIIQDTGEEEEGEAALWNKYTRKKERLYVSKGKTIPEAFLNTCAKFGKDVACTDLRSGTLTFNQLKMRSLLLADYIRTLPGEYIGILLPSSVGAEILILATQLAGKVPLMINWTVGVRHIESVKKLSNVQAVLTSWAFIDRLESVDLDGIEDNLIMLEDARHQFTWKMKLKAYLASRKKPAAILKELKIDHVSEDAEAVLLFTSGSESMPKGVPLSHKNILRNQEAVLEGIEVYSDDVLLSMLPPFHAFGFTVTGLLCPVAGVKTAYSPDPTDGKRLVRAIENWGATIVGGTPTFIKAIMKVAKPEQFAKVRFCFTGAEKAPPELFQLMNQFGKDNFLLEGYGITECSPVLTFNRYGEARKGVGKAANGVELCVVHPDTLDILPIGSQGLILARGPNIFKGYLNPGLTSPYVQVQGKEWYKTGDLGYLDENGYLTISGRLKRFIKIGAEMISLSALEEGLLQVGLKKGWETIGEGPALAVCAKEIPGEKPKIYLFTKFPVALEDVNAALKEAGFSNLVKISQIRQLSEIPIMGSGKTNYRVLESEYVPKLEEKPSNLANPITGV